MLLCTHTQLLLAIYHIIRKLETQNMPQVLAAKQVVLPDRVLTDALVVIEGQKITHISKKDQYRLPENSQFEDFGSKIIAPGLIDELIHGFYGAQASESVAEAHQMAAALVKHGVTAFLPTVYFFPNLEDYLNALNTIHEAIKTQTSGAQMLGINFEAPFLSKGERTQWDRYPPAGLSAGKMARDPSVEELNLFYKASGEKIKIMSIAPELPGAISVIREMRRLGIVPSLGHTSASYEQVMQAVEAGLSSATHLYNGMRRQDHREPGVIEAVLTCDAINAEIIADCIHVHPPALEIAARCKGPDRLILVSDNMKYAGMPDGIYPGEDGRDIVKQGERAEVPGWTLAGSVSPLNHMAANMVHRVGVPIHTAIKMASLNPARQIGVSEQKGSIEIGKDADLIVIDEDINILATMIAGQWVFKNKS
jgi:N-acetylglucosamine-6-phosphate deacetylase